MTKPPRTVLTGWTRNSNEVTTPKLPPPPRSAQNKSSFSLALATRGFPSAVTISNERTLSQVRPYFLTSQPTPPPSASPPMPVLDITPAGTAKPKTWVSRSTSRSVANNGRSRGGALQARARGPNHCRLSARPLAPGASGLRVLCVFLPGNQGFEANPRHLQDRPQTPRPSQSDGNRRAGCDRFAAP